MVDNREDFHELGVFMHPVPDLVGEDAKVDAAGTALELGGGVRMLCDVA